MAGLIIKLFVKNYTETSDKSVREAYGRLSGIVGIITNFLLFAAKAVIGLLSGSISIITDAANNLSDAGSSVITLVGFRLAGKPADDEHPYGHARIEYLTGLIISMIILVIGIQLGKESVSNIFSHTESEFSYMTFAVLGIAILTKLWQCFFYRKISRAISSSAIKASSTDSLSDVLVTSSVLLSTIISKFTGIYLDGYVGLLVAAFIAVSGIKLIKETSDPLLGAAPDPAFVKDITKKILSYENVLGAHDLVVHSYGAGSCFISAHVEVDSTMNIIESHDLADKIESDFKGSKIQLVIHIDPIVTNDERVNDLREQVLEIIKSTDSHLGFHDFRVVFGNLRTNLIFDIVAPAGFTTCDEELCRHIKEKIRKINPKYHTVITVDRDYTSTLNE